MIELVLVLLLISVLATVSFPRLSPSLRKTRLEEAAGNLTAMIVQARSEAVWRRATTKLTFSKDSPEYVFALQTSPIRETAAKGGAGLGLFRNPPPLPGGIRVLRIEQHERAVPMTPILFSPSGVNDPVDIVLFDAAGNTARIHCGTWVDDVTLQIK